MRVLQMGSLRKSVKALRVEGEKREQLLYAFLSFFVTLIFPSSIKLPSSLLHPQPILSLPEESCGFSASATEEMSSRRTLQRL